MSSFVSGGSGLPPLQLSYKKTRSVGSPAHEVAKLKNSLQIGSVAVYAFVGNIADAKAGIIVNPTNQDCVLLPQGVSGALIETEGPTLPLFASLGGSLELGQVKAAKVNHLHAEYVLHLAIDPKPGESLHLSNGEIISLVETAIKNALAETEKMAGKLKLKSVAFPPLGINTLGLPSKEAAKIMLEKIVEQARASSLAEIQIVLPSNAQYYEFNREMNRLQAKISNAHYLPIK